jgi:hypothetical protein
MADEKLPDLLDLTEPPRRVAEEKPEPPPAALAPPARAASAVCAAHADRAASMSCDRCGNFLCGECAQPSPWGFETYCTDCLSKLEAEGGGGRIPWEDRSGFFLGRYWRTVKQVLTTPDDFFRRMPARGLVPAITFQYHTMAYILGVGLLVFAIALRGLPVDGLLGEIALRLGVVAAIAPVEHFLTAGWLYLHLYLFGGRRGFQATYRYTSYLGSLGLAYLAVSLLSLLRIPLLGLFLSWGFVIYAIIISVIAASAVHRIRTWRAAAAILLAAVEGYLLYRYLVVPLFA